MPEVHELTLLGGPLALLAAALGAWIAYQRHDRVGGEHVVHGAMAGAAIVVALMIIVSALQ